MLLVDASVLIDLMHGKDHPAVRYVMQREDMEEAACTPMTYLEVLQGARSDRDMDQARSFLGGYTMIEAQPGLSTYDSAARLYTKARQRGFTIRTAVDCLLAAIAVEHDAVLVHNDRDFLYLGQVEARLQLFPAAIIR